MRTLARFTLVAILVVAMLNLPVFAANEKPLGMIVQAQDSQLGEAKAAIGATVYPGDTLATNGGGTLRLKLGAGQLYLLSSSAATLGQDSNLVKATLSRGTVGFSSSATEVLEVETPLGIVRAADGQSAYGQVTLSGPDEMIVSAYRGELVVDNDGELHSIPEGKSYRVTADLEQPAAASSTSDPQQASGSGTQHRAIKRHLVYRLIFVGGVGVATYFIWQELAESPSKVDH